MPAATHSAAEWAAKQLLKVDWVVRHWHLSQWQRTRPALFSQLRRILSPDDFLYGLNAPVLAPHSIIVMGDMKRKSYKQTLLTKYFRRQPKKPVEKYKQKKLTRYFKIRRNTGK